MNVQIYLNGKEVENTNSNYAYKAYLANLLSYSRESKETFLESEGFVGDTPGAFDDIKVPGGTNTGLDTRYDKFKQNKSIQLRGRLHCDIFNSNRYMLSNVNVTVKLTRSKAEFYLIGSSENHLILIEDCFLRVRRVRIAPSVMLEHAMELEKARPSIPSSV